MSFTKLSTEVTKIIYSHTTLQTTLRLAQTSKANYLIFRGHRLPILRQAIYNTYAPIPELLELFLSNDLDDSIFSIPFCLRDASIRTFTQISATSETSLDFELIKELTKYGKIAERWVRLYPHLRWRFNPSNRRPLREDEKEKLRRAVYICWMYASLFHKKDSTYVQYGYPFIDQDARIIFLRQWSPEELSQVSDLVFHTDRLLRLDLFPFESVTTTALTSLLGITGSRYASSLPKTAAIFYGRHIEKMNASNPEKILDLMDASHEERMALVRTPNLAALGLSDRIGNLHHSLIRYFLFEERESEPFSPSIARGLRGFDACNFEEEDIEAWSGGRECPITGEKDMGLALYKEGGLRSGE